MFLKAQKMLPGKLIIKLFVKEKKDIYFQPSERGIYNY